MSITRLFDRYRIDGRRAAAWLIASPVLVLVLAACGNSGGSGY